MKSLLRELKSTLQSHDKLNPKYWTNEKLDPEVWQALNRISKEWASFANIPATAIRDVILVGGNANFNYTKHSDLDLHLVVDKQKIKCQGLVDDYLQSKKQLWSLTHDITVKGQPVELYAQDFRDPFRQGQGVYSLKSNKWLQQPERVKFNAKSPEVVNKVKEISFQIDSLIDSKSDDIQAFRNLKSRLKGMRASAIEKGGEYAPENLAFKELRNRGYLDKMSNYLRDLEDEDLSLKEAKYGDGDPDYQKKQKLKKFMKGLPPGKGWQGKYDQFGREYDTNTGKLKEEREDCPDGKHWDEKKGKCVKNTPKNGGGRWTYEPNYDEDDVPQGGSHNDNAAEGGGEGGGGE